MNKLLRALSGEKSISPPIWLMRQAGRYLPEYRALREKAGSFLDLCFNPEWAAEVTLQPIRRFDFDAAIIFADILLIPYALGQDLTFATGEGPKLGALPKPGQEQPDRLDPVYEALRRVRSSLPPDKALIGFCGAPWTVACYMIEGSGGEFARARRFARDERGGFLELLDRLAIASADYLCRQIEAGADAVQIFDSWSGLVASEDFVDFVIAPTRKISAEVKRHFPQVPIIGFPRGAGENCPAYARQTGVDGLGLDQTITLDHAAALQNILPVQGNLAPELLVQGGLPMRQAVTAILQRLSGQPFIFNLGHGIVPQTPIEHVTELVRLVRDWSD